MIMTITKDRMNKVDTVSEAILSELGATGQALTSRDLYERLAIDSTDTVVHTALKSLLGSGVVKSDGTAIGRHGRPVDRYRLASADERLMRALESDMAPAAADDDPVLRAIADLTLPPWTDGLRHAGRLRILAGHPVIAAKEEIGVWLLELADEIEARSR